MRRRKLALDQMATIAQQWLKDWDLEIVNKFTFKTEGGGQVGNVSPIAWMRVYSKTKSPNATAGFYVVYLFDAIGENVFLSLNQGTSEYRTGQWRPISDPRKIISKTAEAKLVLEKATAVLDRSFRADSSHILHDTSVTLLRSTQ